MTTKISKIPNKEKRKRNRLIPLNEYSVKKPKISPAPPIPNHLQVSNPPVCHSVEKPFLDRLSANTTIDESQKTHNVCEQANVSPKAPIPDNMPVANVRKVVVPKVPPRSGFQFRVGPAFTNKATEATLYCSNGEVVTPIVSARIDRGFESIDGEWIGYKRNYFTLVTAFEFKDFGFEKFLDDSYRVTNGSETLPVCYFTLKVAARSWEDHTSIPSVQHTAKRESGPQKAPPTHPAVPGKIPSHEIVRSTSNIRNKDKIASLNKIFFYDGESSEINPNSTFKGYPKGLITRVARYERVQFSSSINFRKQTNNHKRFVLLVELAAVVGDGTSIVVGLCETVPLIVRGRSPSNYGDIRTISVPQEKEIPQTVIDYPPDLISLAKLAEGKETPKKKKKTLKIKLRLPNYEAIPMTKDSDETIDQSTMSSYEKMKIDNLINNSDELEYPTTKKSPPSIAPQIYGPKVYYTDKYDDSVEEVDAPDDSYYSYVNLPVDHSDTSGLLSFDLMEVSEFTLSSLKEHSKKRSLAEYFQVLQPKSLSLNTMVEQVEAKSRESSQSRMNITDILNNNENREQLPLPHSSCSMPLKQVYDDNRSQSQDLNKILPSLGSQEVEEINSSDFIEYGA